MTTATTTETATDPAGEPQSAKRSVPWLPVTLIALTVALVAAGVVFLIRAGSIDDSSATSNEALVNRSQTTEVISQVSAALNQVLTYDSAKPQASEAAAKKWLTGDAPAQYQKLVGDLRSQLRNQQLQLVAKVLSTGVTSLRGDKAQLLVFLDQRSSRASDGVSTVGAARVQIAAERTGNTWRITQLKPI